MGKKSLENVTADLSALAAAMPTQRPVAPAPVAAPPPPQPQLKVVPPPSREEEGAIQFSLSMRKELRKELARLASDADMTMRAFVLNALKEKGLSVREDDLIDLRKERR
jgi:hypothetical protein